MSDSNLHRLEIIGHVDDEDEDALAMWECLVESVSDFIATDEGFATLMPFWIETEI